MMIQAGIFTAIGVFVGGLLFWLQRARIAARELERLNEDWQLRFDKEVRNSEALTREHESVKAALDTDRAQLQKFKHATARAGTELESLRAKIGALSKDLFTIGAEKDELSGKMTNLQKTLISARSRVRDLETEFTKSRDFYKGQLMSAFEQRKLLERKVDDAKSEHESLNNLLTSARSEHESVSNMLATAKVRLESLEGLESQLISLEADNAELKHDIATANREAHSAQRNAEEIETIRRQNQELATCLESMENSRRQYEVDARRYRDQYDQSEQESETLRLKLGDIQNRLAEMQTEHEDARKAVTDEQSSVPPFGIESPHGDVDDLTEIVGIGKVFEEMLHRLGIYYYRQIASFGPAELARVNAELKEFKGRIEHDDWIGQAKELHFRKYGEADPQKNAV